MFYLFTYSSLFAFPILFHLLFLKLCLYHIYVYVCLIKHEIEKHIWTIEIIWDRYAFLNVQNIFTNDNWVIRDSRYKISFLSIKSTEYILIFYHMLYLKKDEIIENARLVQYLKRLCQFFTIYNTHTRAHPHSSSSISTINNYMYIFIFIHFKKLFAS